MAVDGPELEQRSPEPGALLAKFDPRGPRIELKARSRKYGVAGITLFEFLGGDRLGSAAAFGDGDFRLAVARRAQQDTGAAILQQ